MLSYVLFISLVYTFPFYFSIQFSNISLYDVTRIAPSLISSLHPSLSFLFISPGIAYTSFPCSIAKSAVISAPLFLVASTTNTPFEIPLIILFLCGKCNLSGFVPIEYSEIIHPPDFIIFFANFFHDAYHRAGIRIYVNVHKVSFVFDLSTTSQYPFFGDPCRYKIP